MLSPFLLLEADFDRRSLSAVLEIGKTKRVHRRYQGIYLASG
jgi:hypothetical protein